MANPPTLPPVFSALQPYRSQSDGPPSLPSCLSHWRPGEQLPATATRTALQTSRSVYQRWLDPGGREVFAVQMDRLLEFAATFGIPDAKAREALGFYRDALAVLPADLMVLAVQRICSGWKRGNRLPLPAEITETVSEELGRRRLEAGRIAHALRSFREEPAPERVSPEQRERNLRTLAQARQAIAAGATAGLPEGAPRSPPIGA